MLDAGNLSCAIEATSYDSDFRRLDRVRFAALVFTNLGHDHLDHHGTLEAYFAAKRRFFLEGTRPPRSTSTTPTAGGSSRSFASAARDAAAHVRAARPRRTSRPEELELSAQGARFRVGGLELRTRLLGAFNVENVLAAVAGARLLGVADDAIAAGVSALESVPGRMEPIDEGQPFSVFVDYAHKPEALEAVLRTARMLTEGRVLCVFGCGGDSYRGKRPLMGEIASRLSDHVILTTDDPRDEDPRAIVEEIAAGGAPDEVELDRRRAIERAVELARPGDVVLVAGRGHQTEQDAGRRSHRALRRPRRGAGRPPQLRVELAPTDTDRARRGRSCRAARNPFGLVGRDLEILRGLVGLLSALCSRPCPSSPPYGWVRSEQSCSGMP